MKIKLSPQRRGDDITVEVDGDVISINGREYDFSDVGEGSTIDSSLIPEEFIVGEVGREGGEIYLTVILPHGANPTNSVAFPEAIHVTIDGAVDLPRDPEPDLPEIEDEVENDVEA